MRATVSDSKSMATIMVGLMSVEKHGTEAVARTYILRHNNEEERKRQLIECH